MTLERFNQMNGEELERFLIYLKQYSNKSYYMIKNRYFKDCTPSESWEDDYDEVWDALATMSNFAEKSAWFRKIIKDFEL